MTPLLYGHMDGRNWWRLYELTAWEHQIYNGMLPFLDVLVYWKQDGCLGHVVYRKPTHTDLYLNANSAHHPAQKKAVLSTLVH